ncbi:MAG: triose-phosphate isomerase [Patescibacteria group bacterium]
MKKLVVANWKMNPKTPLEAKFIAKDVLKKVPKRVEVVLCPPTIFWNDVAKVKRPKNVYLGTQNVFFEDKGAYTGEISAIMAKGGGATFSIVGHSERRALGESDEMIAKKVLATKNAKLIPIICVGEKERDNQGVYLNFLKKQIINAVSLLSKNAIKDICIAYEPLWAIGKDANSAMNSHDVHQTALFIRKVFIDLYGQNGKGVKVLYGGSVAPENCFELVKNGEVDGLLVGHQSLVPENFVKIIVAISKIR